MQIIKVDLYKSCWSILDLMGFGWEISIPILGKPRPKNNPFLGKTWDLKIPLLGIEWKVSIPGEYWEKTGPKITHSWVKLGT